ncbi:MAG: SIS domain-containing protein [Saprospiraceae bacterium]|uniref:SIS domain-containing protein n=1 Tax=Candidatus Opimibacter skivensis TaxID=2982028 RepID=A0A9D7XPC4_9BACT|nr:SIS domain-containing protein [Candidatus Opimibacter skivensis]
MNDTIRDIINREIEGIRSIPIDDSIIEAIDLIFNQVHEAGGKVVVSGLGKAGQIGHNIATTLSSTGTPSVFLHPLEAQHGDLGILQQNDILFLISNSGKTKEIVELLPLAKRLFPDIKSIGLTGHPENELGTQVDVCLSTGYPKEVCPLGLTPTTSTTVMTVLGDVIVVMLMKKIGFTKSDYARRHHSGYLGQKSREDE